MKNFIFNFSFMNVHFCEFKFYVNKPIKMLVLYLYKAHILYNYNDYMYCWLLGYDYKSILTFAILAVLIKQEFRNVFLDLLMSSFQLLLPAACSKDILCMQIITQQSRRSCLSLFKGSFIHIYKKFVIFVNTLIFN